MIPSLASFVCTLTCCKYMIQSCYNATHATLSSRFYHSMLCKEYCMNLEVVHARILGCHCILETYSTYHREQPI